MRNFEGRQNKAYNGSMYSQELAKGINDLTIRLTQACLSIILPFNVLYRLREEDIPSKPSALDKFRKQLDKEKTEVSEVTKILMDPDPMALARRASIDIANCLHIPSEFLYPKTH